jgi:monofunctional biosynthetic peptidoglycan transglycosylase
MRRGLRWCVVVVVGGWLSMAASLVSLRWVNPPFTAVEMERRVQAWMHRKPYRQRSVFLGLKGISPDLQHAVIAAEDGRFYQHHGFDWEEVHAALAERSEEGRVRGASTITQQLVKNLFFGTGRSYLRKGVEATLVPVAEYGLGKQRILELYLNVAEWGPGVYGAEAASRYHYGAAARSIGRERAARLAAILPAPLRWRPEHMDEYSAVILERMQKMGW